MKYLLGIDLGTSGTKTVLFEETGRAVASETIEYPLYQPKNGWAEQEPEDWWNAARDTVKAVMTKSGVNPEDVKGVGISGQMHGLELLDEEGRVLRRSILWCDGRTQEECDEITETIGRERLIEISANPALTGFTAGKILWVRKHEPEIYEKAARLRVDFVLTANELATPGAKTVYVRITSPDGYVLTTEAMPTFDFEGERLSYSAMREVDYQNQDLEVGIYYNSTGFAAGAYTVQLFCDGRLIGTSQIAMR